MENEVKNKEIDTILNIEEQFFDLDKVNKIVLIKLEFNNPDEIFDTNYVSKTPILSDDFYDWIFSSFEMVPNYYNIQLDICFDDLKDYNLEELESIFNKNIALEYKRQITNNQSKNKIAFSLMGVGVVFLITMLLITFLWKEENVFKQIFTYIFDIATTVIFWEALTILVVERKEKKLRIKNFVKRFKGIEFSKMEDKE